MAREGQDIEIPEVKPESGKAFKPGEKVLTEEEIAALFEQKEKEGELVTPEPVTPEPRFFPKGENPDPRLRPGERSRSIAKGGIIKQAHIEAEPAKIENPLPKAK